MKPLYKFELDPETGVVNQLKIDDYATHYAGRSEYYIYNIGNQRYYCYPDRDMDCFKNGRVYSFCPDLETAKEMIKNAIQIKRAKAHGDYLKYTEIVNKMEGWGT